MKQLKNIYQLHLQLIADPDQCKAGRLMRMFKKELMQQGKASPKCTRFGCSTCLSAPIKRVYMEA